MELSNVGADMVDAAQVRKEELKLRSSTKIAPAAVEDRREHMRSLHEQGLRVWNGMLFGKHLLDDSHSDEETADHSDDDELLNPEYRAEKRQERIVRKRLRKLARGRRVNTKCDHLRQALREHRRTYHAKAFYEKQPRAVRGDAKKHRPVGAMMEVVEKVMGSPSHCVRRFVATGS